jgi:hypothetical protein
MEEDISGNELVIPCYGEVLFLHVPKNGPDAYAVDWSHMHESFIELLVDQRT